jgi:hypothetical protein
MYFNQIPSIRAAYQNCGRKKKTVILSEAWALRAGGQKIAEIAIHLMMTILDL